MRKTTSLAILLVAVITLSMTYVILQAQKPPVWQIKLENYLKYRNDTLAKDPLASGRVTLEKTARADQPENFDKISDRWLVVGNHYWLMENREVLSSLPDEVICALVWETVSQEGAEATISYQVVFAANYAQTVEPDWLIYTGDNATAIGCDLAQPL